MAHAIFYRELAKILARAAHAGDGKAASARHKLPIPISDGQFEKLLTVLRDPKFRARHGLTKPSDV